MKKVFRANNIMIIVGLALTALLFFRCSDNRKLGPLVLQALDYTENPIDIPNPDRGAYRGRWQNISPNSVNENNSPFGITPEVDHRVPVDINSVLYHGRQVPPVEGDDIEETEFYNGVNQNVNPYLGGTEISALPSISFMCFDLCNFSSNAFLSAKDAFGYKDDGLFSDSETGATRTGKTQPLTPFALDYMRGLLQKVRDGNGVAFVKFSYDGNGFNYIESHKYPNLNLTQGLIHGPEPTFVTDNNPSAMCNIPGHEDKNWIQYHIWQLKPIFEEYEDVIMSVKTGMLGPWGEQHSSPEAQSVDAYKMLLDAYLDAVPASRALLTHAGGFLAWYNETYGTAYTFTTIDTMPIPPNGSPEGRFGFFNDSYAAGSWGDNGSISEGNPMIESRYGSSAYDRYKVVKWFNKQNQILQGEGGIGDNVFGNMPGAIMEANQLRTTALNMRHGRYNQWNDFIYNEANVTKPVQFPANEEELNGRAFTGEIKKAIFDPVYDGRTGLEYFRDRLGYRLVLREANVSEFVMQNGGTLRFEGKIQNVGFGNVVNEKKVSVILKSKDGSNSYVAATNLDAREWLTDENGNGRPDNTSAWRDLNFSIKVDAFGEVPRGDYDIFLKINDPKETSTNKRCIQFANHKIWNTSLGANLIGSTTVTQ
ncbi:protein of unknown function [Pricia antarctica]|uniref:DUF4832 domain-containing protein n=1 Tax=Pricia antarctica TaxID=641691 RepID=A0A1G7FX87_9FLAO|nr:DUF4832 domain-containing protein [Pricia antarctica]SDE80365.1 protein of unknown function [Pricia antarctica]